MPNDSSGYTPCPVCTWENGRLVKPCSSHQMLRSIFERRIEVPKPEEPPSLYLLACVCSSTHFVLLADGVIRCARCSFVKNIEWKEKP